MMARWLEFVRQVAQSPGMVTGVRKVAFDQKFELTWEELTSSKLTYEDLGYTRTKGRQLERIYWPVPEVEAAFAKLASRKGKPHSSVAIQLKNGIKDSRSQGRCLQNMVVTQTDKLLYVDIFYRSTEVIQKFLADLVFFSQKLPTYFPGRKPNAVRMHFANTYLSAVFVPILLRYDPDPMEFFTTLKEQDPKFFRTFGLAARRNFNPTCVYNYRTRVKQWEYHQEHVGNVSSKMRPVIRLLSTLKGEIIEEPEPDEL